MNKLQQLKDQREQDERRGSADFGPSKASTAADSQRLKDLKRDDESLKRTTSAQIYRSLDSIVEALKSSDNYLGSVGQAEVHFYKMVPRQSDNSDPRFSRADSLSISCRSMSIE